MVQANGISKYPFTPVVIADPPPSITNSIALIVPTYVLILEAAVFLLVPPAPLSITKRSASTIASPISVPPSISNVANGVVPAVNPAPEPVKLVALNTPVELNDAVSAATPLAAVLKLSLVALLEELKSPSDTASIPAAIRTASVPVN